MKNLPWIVAGIGVGAAVTWLLFSQPSPQYATGSDTIEDAANRTFGWGSRQGVAGAGANLAGKVKEGVGRLTGDQDLADQGTLDQAAGHVKAGAGKFARAMGETIHDLNR
jgi:uncharacterized protein YjbJ (UPF0337 family)